MYLTIFSDADSIAQLITVLLVFVFVLGLCWFTTKWIAGYQRQQNKGNHVEVVESSAIGNGKYVQIIKIADKYVAVATCKDTVTYLTEIPKEQIHLCEDKKTMSFMELFTKAKTPYQMTNKESQEYVSKEELDK